MKPKQSKKPTKKNPLENMTVDEVFGHLAKMGIRCIPKLVPKQEFEPFAMLHVEGKDAPTVRHASVAAAYAEAKRLALKEQANVFILESIGCIHPLPQEIEFAEPKGRLSISPQADKS